MLLRSYADGDAEATLLMFRRAIRTLASADYSPAQRAAWASDDIDLDAWASARRSANTTIATVDDRVAGFTDVSTTGFIDMLFVDPDFARRGVASALLEWATDAAAANGASMLTTHASLTARPFFEHHGFTCDEQRHPALRGVRLVNFAMSRRLATV